MKSASSDKLTTAKPFLRWAGGKSWLIKHLKNVKSLQFNQYHEPFLGGGSAFFYFDPTNGAYLSDLNKELIDTYTAIRDNVDRVIKKLKSFENTEQYYYKIRETTFNNNIENAAKFIFLNQTSFNGIYRVNLKGIYNVPYGFRSKEFINEPLLNRASQMLKNTQLSASDFDIVRKNILPGDLVFLDPPYTVSHNDNGFIRYNEKLFSLEDQYRLSELISFIKEQDAFYILTNAAHHKVKEIFHKNDNMHELSRANLIGGLRAERGSTKELVFTNFNM